MLSIWTSLNFCCLVELNVVLLSERVENSVQKGLTITCIFFVSFNVYHYSKKQILMFDSQPICHLQMPSIYKFGTNQNGNTH